MLFRCRRIYHHFERILCAFAILIVLRMMVDLLAVDETPLEVVETGLGVTDHASAKTEHTSTAAYQSTANITNTFSLSVQLLTTETPLNPHPYPYILKPSEACSSKRDLFILTVVHTAPGNYKQRMLIRETWGNPSFYSEIQLIVLFMMGATPDPKLMHSIEREHDQYHDIVQEDFLDSYKNLTLKSVMWLKFASTFCPQIKYLVKCDDDIFINVFSLTGHLRQLYNRGLASERTILCLVWDKMKVMREPANKWFVSNEEYSKEFFSKYCSGSAYILTGDLVYPMYQKSLRTKFFWVDDFYTTGLLLQDANAQYYYLNSLYVLRPSDTYKLKDGTAVIGHIPGSLKPRYDLWRSVLAARRPPRSAPKLYQLSKSSNNRSIVE